MTVGGLSAALLPQASAAVVGQGFTVSAADLSFILKQIKIAENHANSITPTDPCAGLLGTGPNQIASPLLSFGLRTVDGSCNNLQPGQARFGAADQVFPRLTTPVFRDAGPSIFAPPGGPNTSYKQKKGSVFDTEPRVISNLIVDQTSTNPAAVAAAGFPVRTQGNPGLFPCTVDPDPNVPGDTGTPAGCVPSHETLFIPNVTTDVGLSPPYNSLFTLFGQFFDHGVDQTVKGGSGTVFVPLQADDPLIPGPDHILGNADDLDPGLRFMVLTRARNQAGPDGIVGDPDPTAPDTSLDDVQNAVNTDSPWVDQSQTYTSHPAHQAFLREYVAGPSGPVATGRLLGGEAGTPQASGMATWATVKLQARTLLGLDLTDASVEKVPMLATDPYGNFIPGPSGLPQYVTAGGLVEGNLTTPVPVPTDVLLMDTPFLTDIAKSAVPTAGGPDANNTAGNQLDIPVCPATAPVGAKCYDDELLDTHFAAGDGRVNENIGLSAIHQIFHSEHDRLVGDITNTLNDPANTDLLAAYQATSATTFNFGERLFQAARFVTEMEYQHLVFEEFARKVQPGIVPFAPFAFTQTELNPAVKAEFAHAVYRFGHSMLTETISRTNVDGSKNDIPLLDGFLNPPSYTQATPGGPSGVLNSEQAAGSIIMGMSDQVGNELDEFVTDTLRNNLLGLPLDLPTVNMTRARSEGIPPLNEVRRQIFANTNDGQVQPYLNWVDFGQNLKHPESMINFIAAYGTHPSIQAATTTDLRREAALLIVDPPAGADPLTIPADADDFLNGTGAWADDAAGRTTTGLDSVDLWVGGLAEKTNLFGGLLGSTFNYVFENQLTELQQGDRLYYLARTPGMNLRSQLEGNSFAELIMRNTEGTHTLKADPFATADCKFELANLVSPAPPGSPRTGPTSIADDPLSECDENDVLLRLADGTIQYRFVNNQDPTGINGQAVYNGTGNLDKIKGGVDNDTFWGGPANDRIDGNGGDDVILGGEGNDIITDSSGIDVPKGGPGNDAIDGGPGDDIVMGGDGSDFTNGGTNINETFAGAGNDFAIAGGGEDAVFGDGGDDWAEGGDAPDLLIGDSSTLFFDDHNLPGHDVLIGQGGDDDYDMEGGDDIGLAGPGVEKNAGGAGYDWLIGQSDPQPQNTDLAIPLVGVPLPANGVRDKFNEVEALSGADFNDTLRGDSIVPSAIGGGGFIGCDALDQSGLDRIAGLDVIVPPLTTPTDPILAATATQNCLLKPNDVVWGDGNILLGGAGSDLLEGRGADDILDGDRYVAVRLSIRTDPAIPATETGSTDLMEHVALSGNFGPSTTGKTLQQAVFAGQVDPGNIVVVREVKTSPAGPTNIDTATFTGLSAGYTITLNVDGSSSVSDAAGAAIDGTDTLWNVECLQFADRRVALSPDCGQPPVGTVNISDITPTEDQLLTATPAFTDADGIASPITFTWQSETTPGNWVSVGSVSTFTPGDAEVGFPLRVVASYTDGLGILSSVTSAATAPVANINDPVTGVANLSTTAPQEGVLVTVDPGTIADADGLPVALNYQWTSGPAGGPFVDIAGATGTTFTPTLAQVGQVLRVRVSFTDLHGTAETASSAQTAPVIPAPTVPAAPTGVTAVGGIASATVSWTAPADGGAPIDTYTVQVLTAGGSLLFSQATPAAGTSLLVPGLSNGTQYKFRVLAHNGVGNGPLSAESNVITTAAAPGAPTITTLTRGVASVTVGWTAPADNGAPITSYTLQAFNPANVQVGADIVVAGGVTSATVTGLTVGVSYTFQVRATNGVGDGPFSVRSAAATPATVPGAPTIGATSRASGSITVNWTAPLNTGGIPLTGYQVRVINNGTNAQVGAPRPVSAAATSFTLTAGAGVTTGTAYRFEVRAQNAVGNSPFSAGSTAQVFATVPGAPVNGTPVRGAAGGALTFTASWTAPANGGSPITGYRVYAVQMSGGGAGATPVAETPSPLLSAATTSFTFTVTTAAGTNYRFQVEAINALGTGPRSPRSANVVPR